MVDNRYPAPPQWHQNSGYTIAPTNLKEVDRPQLLDYTGQAQAVVPSMYHGDVQYEVREELHPEYRTQPGLSFRNMAERPCDQQFGLRYPGHQAGPTPAPTALLPTISRTPFTEYPQREAPPNPYRENYVIPNQMMHTC